jgi:hypothetical protein
MSTFRFGNQIYEYEGAAPDSSVAHNIAPLVSAELKNARSDAQARQAAIAKEAKRQRDEERTIAALIAQDFERED